MHPSHGPKAESSWMRSPKSTSPEPSRSSGQFGAAGNVRPRVLTFKLVFVGIKHAPVAGTQHAPFRIRTIRAHAVGFVTLENAAAAGAIFGRRGVQHKCHRPNSTRCKQTVVLHVVSRERCRLPVRNRWRANSSSLRWTECSTRPPHCNRSRCTTCPRHLPRPACVLTVVGRLGAAHS